MTDGPIDYRLDEIDRRVIHALMTDARGTSAPTIAEGTGVSAGTIRNRISRLEERGIIRGYHAHVDFERADGRLTSLLICTAPTTEREALAREAASVDGVINVRELMAGSGNLHVLAVGEEPGELRRVARTLSERGLEIEKRSLLRDEVVEPYGPFGPDENRPAWHPAGVVSLPGGADVVEVRLTRDAPLVDRSLAEAADCGLLDDDVLVVTIERGGRVLTPRGETVLQAGDIVTLLSKEGAPEAALEAFHGGGSTTK